MMTTVVVVAAVAVFVITGMWAYRYRGARIQCEGIIKLTSNLPALLSLLGSVYEHLRRVLFPMNMIII